MVLILLLIGSGGGYAVWTAHASQLAATATAVIHSQATVTANAAISAYNTYVSEHGNMLCINAQHTCNNPYERILNVTNVSRLRQKWVAATGGPINSSPVVVNGMVYAGSYDGKLYAFSLPSAE